MASRQAQMQAETDRLSQQQQDARAQLRDLQRQIEALQAEQARLSALDNGRSGARKASRTTYRNKAARGKKTASH